MHWHRRLPIAVASLALLSVGCAHKKAAAPASAAPQPEARTVTFSQGELQPLALQPLEIIWPQVLDGPISGEALYRLTVDATGIVTDVQPLTIAVERSNDSVIRQIMRWKFKPLTQDGVPVQAEVVWAFHFNTRAFGPSEPLTEAEARKLATKVVDPGFPPGTPSGTTCSMRIAVDSDGYLIEVIEGSCPRELAIPCLHAVQAWQFTPVLESGQPRPYRSEITFRVP